MHEAAGPQQREQRAPAFRPVAHVMEHAAHFDQIEAAPKCGELQDIGLRIVDMVEMNRARLADGVTEAGTAQIDGEHARLREPPGGLDGVLAGAAARDENIEAALWQSRAYRRCWKLAAQVPVDRHR